MNIQTRSFTQYIKSVKKIALLVIMLSGLLGITNNVEAAGGVATKINSILNQFPSGSYFTANGKACTHSSGGTCNNCKLSNVLSSRGIAFNSNYSDGWTCYAFAVYCFGNIFQQNYYGAQGIVGSGIVSSNAELYNAFSKAKMGDFVYCFNGNTIKHYAIFISCDSNGVTLLHNNIGGSNTTTGKISYGYVPYSNLRGSGYGYNRVDIYRAKNYDAINGSSGGDIGTSYNPQGVYESCEAKTGKVSVSGWAFDLDNPSESIDVHVYIGGMAGSGAPGYAVQTTIERADVNETYGVQGKHGFAADIATDLRGEQDVYIYAINVGGGTANTELGHMKVNIPGDFSNIRISNYSSDGFDISCTLPSSNMQTVYFPTWPSADDSGNPIWHQGTISGDTATCRINVSEHGNKRACLYVFHIYAYDSNNKEYGWSGSAGNVYVHDSGHQVISNVQVSDESEKGFMVTCSLEPAANITSVSVPTWGNYNGDPIWHGATVSGNTATCYVSASEHGNNQGTYQFHIYASADNGAYYAWSTGSGKVEKQHEHSYSSEVIKAATCLETGERKYTCSCGDSYTEEILATGHIGEIELRDQKEATTDVEGYTGDTYCKDCGTKLETGEVIPKLHVHSYNTKVTKQSACLEVGVKTYTCSCGEFYTEEIPATGHIGETEIRNQKDATTEEDGYTGDTYCKDCGTMMETGEVIPKLHTHSYSNTVTKQATCLEAGVKTYICSCGDSYTEEIPATGHIGETEIRGKKEATADEEGYTGDTYCKDCGTKLATGRIIPKQHEHSFVSTVTKNPTCTEVGKKVFLCSCGDSYAEDIAANGHGELEVRNKKEATETAEGYTGDIYCKVCDTMLQKGTETNRLTHTHSYVEKVTQEANCIQNGIKTYTCECGDTYNEEIPATGHIGGTVVKNAVAATANTEGYTGDTYCAACDTLLQKGQIIAKLVVTPANPVGKTVTVSGQKYTVTDAKGFAVSLTAGEKKATVNIPASITIDNHVYTVTGIAANAFYKNTKITKITIPQSITVIERNAFYGCKKLKKVSGCSGVRVIGAKAFYGCSKLTAIGALKQIETIGDYAFGKCKALSKINAGGNLGTIGKGAFSGCAKLKSIVLSSSNLKVVGRKAFSGIYKKAVIKVPSKYYKQYLKILKNRGQSKTVKITKK